MLNRFYNKEKFQYITSLIDINPFVARKEIEDYISQYGEDYFIIGQYIYCLIILGYFDEAEIQLKEFEFSIEGDKYLNRNPEVFTKIKARLISNKINLLMRQGKYQELYDYYQSNFHLIRSLWGDEHTPLMFYCKKMLGMLDVNRREQHTYIFRQIVNYDENDFLEHIKKHLIVDGYNNNGNDEINPCIFNENFPLNEVIEELKRIIPSEGDKRLYYNFYVSIYVFRYDNCGKVNGRSVNYFKVVCFQNTNNFITMYPDVDCKDLPHTDLNYLNMGTDRTNDPKRLLLAKRESRIDKFNKRFGLK